MLSLHVLLAFVGLSSAHFVLLWPPNAGFDEDKELTEPCGSYTPEVGSDSPKVQVDRFAIAIENVSRLVPSTTERPTLTNLIRSILSANGVSAAQPTLRHRTPSKRSCR